MDSAKRHRDNMAPTTRNGKNKQSKKGQSSSKKGQSSSKKGETPKTKRPREEDEESEYSEDEEPEETPKQPSKDELMEQLKALQGEILVLKSATKTGKRGKKGVPNPIAAIAEYIPTQYEDEVKKYVTEETSRKTNFITSDEDHHTICQSIMAGMPEFQGLISENKTQTNANVTAFLGVYGKVVTKTINNNRTNAQGLLRKSYIKRYLAGKYMPSTNELLKCAQRDPELLLNKVPKLLKYPDEADCDEETWAREKAKIDAENKEIQTQIDQIKAANVEIDRMQEIFQWYWTDLLPDVVGKRNWGHNIRRYVTITKGTFPDKPDKKYITDEDEALLMVLWKNCDNRFEYAAKCKKNNQEEDKDHDDYQSRWSDARGGARDYGGFHVNGLECYKELFKTIALKKQKKHVEELENQILARINSHPMEDDHDDEDQDSKPKAQGTVSVALLELDPEVESSDIEDLDTFESKPKKKKKKKKARTEE